MHINICSLNSGSNANCYYVGNENEAVLIDTGLSCRETEKRMTGVGLSMDTVKAIFISHEHSDHVTGLAAISKKYQLPVYITEATLGNCKVPVDENLVQYFQQTKPVNIGNLKITSFKKNHDAADAHSFMISGYGINIGVITDIGFACKKVIKYFGQCHAAFLESNYCDTMLANGNYPYYLQERISSDVGHLSNKQAVELFKHYRPEHLQLLILSHLSKNNNKPELVENLFTPYAGATKIIVASRYEASPIYRIEGNPVLTLRKQKQVKNENQLSLF
ncbi:MAG: MBL fold metallo-hydrolase [Chitinophagaceae bacterium]|nr:MBL fold metallo-hydrolase [Chitinophagaceae bacterium]